jgi:uncharacterized membrane protein
MVLLGLGIVGIVLGIVISNPVIENVGDKLVGIANLMAWYYLYYFGRLRFTRWRAGLFVLVALFIIGALFKIQHWPIANTLCTISMLGIPVYYAMWYLSKREKGVIDHLKLICVCFQFISTWLIFTRLLPAFIEEFDGRFVIQATTIALIQGTYIFFVIEKKKQLARPPQSWDIDPNMPPPPSGY